MARWTTHQFLGNRRSDQEDYIRNNPSIVEPAHAVLGQKYAFATASLVLGVACFINLLGFEKAVLARAFGWLTLKEQALLSQSVGNESLDDAGRAG